MSSDEMQFGEVQHAAPRVSLRPDENRHFAVCAYGNPSAADLPVFIDLDVLRDMEQHALSDTSVELGGVMLGGQFVDEAGQPFVLISDGLRAEHYESTRGSFKFTHETWERITRERDEFPADLEMVGWYHTHPDWGVFLSGMDMFICDHFFNRPLDVALVIDPVRADRGVFQWTQSSSERVRRLDGFYVVASRFRQDELNWFTTQLAENPEMARQFMSSGGGVPSPAPVIHLHDRQTPWMTLTITSMLLVQFLLLALIGWNIIDRAPEPTNDAAVSDEAVRVAAQRELLGRVVTRLQDAPEDFLDSLEELDQKNRVLQASNAGLHFRLVQIEAQKKAIEDSKTRAEERLQAARANLDELRADHRTQQEELDALRQEKEDGAGGATSWDTWMWVILAAVAVGTGLGGGFAGWTLRGQREEMIAEDEQQGGPAEAGPDDQSL